MIYVTLFYEFFKTGLFAVGGGLATLPFLRQMSISHPDWFTESMLADMIAVSESTPGPIGVNMATYAGFQAGGILGALSATLGLIAPAFLVMLIVVRVLTQFRDNRYVNAAFYGLRPAVTGLIAAAGVTVAKGSLLVLPFTGDVLSLFNWPSIAIFAVVLFLTRRFKAHPILFLLGSAVVGILIGFLQNGI